MADTIAFLGLGSMGLPMAQNLAKAGFAVRAWNRTASKAAQVEGATACKTPREAAQGAAVALTMLADDRAVEEVVFGDEGLLAGLAAGAVHAGMSTCSPALSRRLEEAHRKAGQKFVAAPVFGRPDAAAAKQLRVLAGGDRDAIERARPALAALGQAVLEVGDAPQASLAKLAGNFLIASLMESFAEALALVEKAGMDPAKMADLYAGALFAGAPIPKGYATRIASAQFEPAGFALPLGAKDVRLVLGAGEELKVPLPLAALLREHLLGALARGRDKLDWAGLATVVRENAGLAPSR